jgi:hypothetical protein
MRRRVPVVAVLAAALGIAVTTTSANAAVPCRDRIYNDWYRDGKVASTYPLTCYRDALRHVPADARIYSSLETDIRSALQAAIERAHGKKNVPAQVGRGLPAARSGVQNASMSLRAKGKAGAPEIATPRPPGTQVSAAPAAATGSGGGLPLPILVLGGLALLLAATGLIGVGVRRFRR